MKKAGIALLSLFAAAVVIAGGILLYHVALPPGCGEIAGGSGIPCGAVIAHRGASYHAPEETAPAYLLARDLGADYLEMDIQRTSDGVLVALHDDTLERTTNVRELFPGREREPISSFTLAELKRLDAGSWFNATYQDRAREAYSGVRIPSLDEIIDLIGDSGTPPGLYIETKSPRLYPGIEGDLVRLLRRRGWIDNPSKRGRVILQSFSAASLEEFAKLAPNLPRVYLVDEEMAREQGGWSALVRAARAAGSGIGPIAYLAYPWHTGPAHRAGLLVHVYTINLPWQMRLSTLFGADGIFTDRCDLLLRLQGRTPAEEPRAILSRHGF